MNANEIIHQENKIIGAHITKKIGLRQIPFHHVNFNDRRLERMMGLKPASVPDGELNVDEATMNKLNPDMSMDEVFLILPPDEAKIYTYVTSLNRLVWNRIRNSIIQLVCLTSLLLFYKMLNVDLIG